MGEVNCCVSPAPSWPLVECSSCGGRRHDQHTNDSRLPLHCFVVFVSVFTAIPAEAHLNSTGMGPVYDGLLHFLLSPEDFVSVLALALLAGLRGAAFGRRTLFVLPGAWLRYPVCGADPIGVFVQRQRHRCGEGS